MKKLSDLEYLKLSKPQALIYNLKMFICSLPEWFKGLFVSLLSLIKAPVLWIRDEAIDIFRTFTEGNWAVKLSFLIFGFGNFYYGQIMRGILFLLFEAVFIVYMFVPFGPDQIGTGLHWLGKCNWFQTGSTVGTVQSGMQYNELLDIYERVDGDDSVRVLLYGLLTVIFVCAFIGTWRMQVKQCRICMDITASGKKIKSGKQDLQSLLDDQFHKTLLTPSLTGILLFTVLPIVYMIIVAFTNYDYKFNGYNNLFSWVGFDNFNSLSDFGNGGLGLVFSELLGWTLMWAIFATFSNYFLGMIVAMMINKKGIKLKKFWRTVLVMTIAIPQFVSLLYVSKMFGATGMIGSWLDEIPFIHDYLRANFYQDVWKSPEIAKLLLIVINIWIGIPYVMLMATGILMNIPADLYESAKIDGANGTQQFTKITLPYMLFVTGPYLLTSFVGNLNNFNVIYLLTGGSPENFDIGKVNGVAVGHTDLLITWLFKVTAGGDPKYYLASVVGILIFIVVAVLSLIIYNVIPSTKNEEDFA
jgi:arabinogalactan oligomer/maltooligosaccharide transport system permease protein